MKKYVCLLLMFFVSSCAVNKTLQATGGSKSDGIIEMTYSYGTFERPIIDWDLAARTAAKRCISWGYKSAESFGGSLQSCNSYYNGSCNSYLVTIKYQCLD